MFKYWIPYKLEKYLLFFVQVRMYLFTTYQTDKIKDSKCESK